MAQDQYDATLVGRAARGRRLRRFWPGRAIGSWPSIGRRFPSDTISTHVVHPTGVAALNMWGLLDRLTATGCPPIDTYAFDFGPFTISGAPVPTTPPSRTPLVAQCSTSCSLTPRPRPEPRSARGSPSKRSLSRTAASPGFAATARAASPSPSARRWSSEWTDCTRSSPRRCSRSSTTRSRSCCAATTPTGAACRWTAARPTSARARMGGSSYA
jgi:hypothetical protein